MTLKIFLILFHPFPIVFCNVIMLRRERAVTVTGLIVMRILFKSVMKITLCLLCIIKVFISVLSKYLETVMVTITYHILCNKSFIKLSSVYKL